MFLNDASLSYQYLIGSQAHQSVMDKTINDLKMTIQTLTTEMDDLKVNRTPNNINDHNNNYSYV